MSLLSEAAILERLKAGDIFRRGSYRHTNVRAAGYDLRIAADRLTFEGRTWPKGDFHPGNLKLKPGDVAFVSTVELFSFAWDLAGNIGVRFRFSQQGLVVFTGLLVDPGFGLTSTGATKDSHDVRLHFYLANVGSESVHIRLGDDGDRVLSLQFFSIVPPKSRKPPGQAQPDLRPEEALGLFPDVRKALIKANGLEDRLDSEVKNLERQLSELRRQVDTTRDTSEQVVLLGVFLILTTLVGVLVSIGLQALGESRAHQLIQNINDLDLKGYPETFALLGGIIMVMTFVFFSGRAGARAYRSLAGLVKPHRQQSAESEDARRGQ